MGEVAPNGEIRNKPIRDADSLILVTARDARRLPTEHHLNQQRVETVGIDRQRSVDFTLHPADVSQSCKRAGMIGEDGGRFRELRVRPGVVGVKRHGALGFGQSAVMVPEAGFDLGKPQMRLPVVRVGLQLFVRHLAQPLPMASLHQRIPLRVRAGLGD